MAKLGLQQSPLEAALQQAESVSYGLPDDLKKQFEQDRIKAESRRKNTDQQYDARVTDLSSRNAAVTGGATWDRKLTGSTSFIQNNPDVFAGYSPQQMHWIAAISAQESAGNPTARSPVGAFGLMQVMPATGRDPGYGIKPLRDGSVRENVRLGLGKFEAMMSRFNGDVDKALAAYNAGEGNVDKAVARARKYGGDWKAYLPRPQETIPYINNVKGYYNAIGSKGGVPTSAAQPAPTKQATTADSRYRPLSETELKRMQEAQAQGLDTFVPFAGAKPIKIGQQPGKKAPKQENEDAGFLSDTGNLLLSGVNSSVEAAHEIAGRLPGISIGVAALDKIEEYFTGKTPQQIFKEVDEKYNKKLSNETAEARKKRWIIEPGDDLGNGKKATEYSFGDAWKDPRAYYAGIVESAPEMVATMGGSLTLAKGAFKAALKSGATREVASKKAATTATIAGGILEGGFGGAHAAVDVRKEIKSMSNDMLKNSDVMKTLMAEGKTFEQARNQLAEDAATKAFVVAGVGTGIFGGMGDRAIAQVITKGTSSRLKSAVGGAIGEGLLEEAPQSAAQQMAQNYAVQDADPNRSLMKGVANQAAGGAVLGGIMGGGIGAAGHRADVPQVDQPVAETPQAEEVPQAATEAPVQDVVPEQPIQVEQPPRKVGPLERALGGEESLNTAIDNEIAAVAADQWLGVPGTVTKISPKADPESVYTVTVEGYENGEVFARDQDGTPMQFGQDDIVSATPVNYSEIPNSSNQDNTAPSGNTRTDGETEFLTGGATIVHGSGNSDLKAEDVTIVRVDGQKQGKKGRKYGGFYGTSEADASQAEGYAEMMGGSPTLYDVKIKAGTKVLKKTGDVTRLSENYINELVAQGYGVVVGKDPRGRTEYVVIDKNAIESMNARPGKNTGTEQGHAPDLTDFDYTPKQPTKAAEDPNLSTFDTNEGQSVNPEPVKKVEIEQPEKTLGKMSEDELRARVKYLADKAKLNGGWTKRLMSERNKVEKALANLAKAQHQVEENQKPPTTADAIKHGMAEISRGMDEGARNQVAEYIREGNTDRLTYRKEDAINAALSNPNYNVQRNDDGSVTVIGVKTADGAWHGVSRSDAQPASSFKDQILDAHVNNPAKKAQIIADEIKATGRTRSDVFGEVSRIVDEYEANKPNAEATDETPAPLMGADGKPKWFFSRDKAEAFITKKKLGDQYQVNEVSKNRFEIHPIAAATQETAPSNAAPTVAKTETVQLETKQTVTQWKEDMQEALAKADQEHPLYKKLALSAKNGLRSEHDREVALRQAREIEKQEQPAPKSKPSDFIEVISVGGKKAPTAEQVVQKSIEPKAETDQFADNKLFTADKVAAARARLKSKFGRLNSGIDPEVLIDGMTIAGAYIESGVRKFSDYSKAMIEDLGDGVKPYLLSFWEGARNYPGLDTTGMTSVEDSAKEHAALLTPADVQTEAVGQIADKPKTRTKKTGAKGDMVLTQDWGVEHIDGYSQSNDREIGNDTKDAFLKETRNYLNAVADALRTYGFEPHLDSKGKPEKPVYVNESGMAGSGDVSLVMQNPDNGNNVYITIGDTSLRGVVPTTPSGIAIMYRVGQNGDRYATRGTNTWSPVDLSANDLAKLVNSRVRPITTTEESQNARTVQSNELSAGNQSGAQENATTGNRDSEPMATGVAQTSSSADRGEPVSSSTQGAGRSGTGSVQRGNEPASSTSRDSGSLRTDRSTADAVADPATAETSPKPEIDQPSDFDLKNEDIGKGGLTKKYKDNIAAIRILKAMDAEGRVATPDERKAIARYVGWGALKGVFDKDNKQWAKEYTELKGLLTDAEYKAARASTLNAHYTSPTVVGGIFKALEQMGFTSGRVLEPSVGTGNFFGLMPASMRKKSQLHGVELDPLTSQIAAALYPSAKIAKATGFQDFQIPSEYFDLAIGNPPFGSEPIVDNDRSPYSGSSIHNYFFAKSIDKLRPGGLLTMVVSHNFMDANNDATRKWISERADLVSAVRLPRTAFKENAGTDVVTDILVFRKRAAADGAGDASWVKTGTQKLNDPKTGNEVEHRVSSYFLNNPQNVLGTPSAAGSMYRAAEYTVEPNGDLGKQLSDWAGTIPANMYQPIERTHEKEAANVTVPDGVKVGSYFVGDNGAIQMRGPDSMGNRTATEWTAPNAKAAERMKGMIGLRDALREQMRLEKSPETTEKQIEDNRAELNRLYDDFRKDYGFLNDQTNRRIFLDDTESALLLALEFDYDKGVSKAVAAREEIDARAPSAVKADIFNRRVMFPPADNIKVSNANDALLASLNYKARLDLPYMASLYDKTEVEIIQELGDVVFNDPINGYVMADEYLSGDVKTKLAEAQEAAKDNPEFKRNVDALKKVIPADKLPSEIHAALGASFIPNDLYEQFAKELTGANHKVAYVRATGQWVINASGMPDATLNLGKWGIAKMPAVSIFARTMAGQGVVVTETVSLGYGKTETRVLEKETEAAREKQAAIKAEWQRWLWSDPDRADRVASIYNEKMNRIVVRKYDGSHMTFPGMSPAINLLEHQKNAVWRALQSRQVLLDHTVGAGKTFEIVALFMEMRRLGIARKPFIAVPNHLTLQWRSEFSRLYPGANVLAATPEDFSKGNREKFFSKIVTGDWDAVIVGHSSLKKIALPVETEKAVLEEQISEIAEAIEQLKRERGDRNIIRDMEGIRARLDARMKQRIQALGERDKVVTFDELGVDAFAIDELHEFKNLFYNSTMERVPGMGNPSGSDKAFDLFVKLQWMFNTFGDKAPIAGATGTPVSNSLVEMFNMQRLLQYPSLKKDGLHVFDAWAKQFGSVESLYEVSPSGTGYRQSSRFAKFKNLPALMAQYQTFADTVTLDDLKAQEEAQGKAFPVPKVFGGRPQNIVAKRSPEVASFMGTPQLDIQDDRVQFGFNVAAGDQFEIKKSEQGDHFNVTVTENIDGAEIKQHIGTAKTEEDARLMLVEQALSPKIYVDPKSILGQFANLKELNKKTKGKVNALSLTGQANKAGLDYRLINPNAPDFAGSKINMAVDRMMETYKKWDADKGTQLVFCDLSVPKSARSGYGAKERRAYVRDEKGALTHKKATLHTAEGFEDLPFLVVKEAKTFVIYDAATGLRIRGDLPSKAVAVEWSKETLSDDAKRQRWIDARDSIGDLDQDAIDDYNNANEIDTEETEAISLIDIAGASGAADFSVYDDIKAKLIAKGVPEREIAFIHDYSTPVAKEKLFKAVNAGTIRFLIGSTPKMGAGTNVQKRLVGLHHIDAPWRPSDLEQREGRIIRRGNTLYERDPSGFEVEIYRYATEQTYDTRRWQILEHKSRGIEQLRNYDGTTNEIDDIEGEAANAADMKAAASGDPLILEETQLRNDVRRLESLQAAHADSTQMMFRRARDNQRFADEVGPRALEEHQKLLATAEMHPVKKDQFVGVTVEGRSFTDRDEAVKAIQKQLVRVFSGERDATFNYRGIEFTIENTLGYVELNSPTGRLDSFDPSKDSVPSAAGFLTRFANYINRLPAHIDDLNAKIAEAKQSAVDMREQANAPFAQADELTAAREAHKRVQRRLIAKGPDIPAKQKPLLDKAMEAQKAALRDQGLGDAMDEFIGSRQNSRGQATNTGTTVADVRKRLVERFGKETITRLEDQGVLNIEDSYYIPDVEGYSQGGNVTLIASTLTPDTIVPVFLHELGGHVGMQGMMKPTAYKNLMDQFNRLVKVGDKTALEAKRLAEREIDPETQEVEYLPYLITVAARQQNKRPGIRTLVSRIVAAVKAWAVDRLGMNINLNANDVLALAERMVNTIGKASGTGSRRFSREDQTNTPEFKKWFGDSKVVDANGNPQIRYHGTRDTWTQWDKDRAGGLIHTTDSRDIANDYAQGAGGGRKSVDPMYRDYYGNTYRIDATRGDYVNQDGDRLSVREIQDMLDVGDINAEYEDARVMSIYVKAENPLNLKTPAGLKVLAGIQADTRLGQGVVDAAADGQFNWNSTKHEHQRKHWANDLVPKLKAQGYDAIIFSDDGHETLSVFDSEQIKSATDNTGAFDANNPDIRFSRRDNTSNKGSDRLDFDAIKTEMAKSIEKESLRVRIGNLPSDMLTETMSVLLRLSPARMLFREVGHQMPSLQKYWDLKEKMDTMRNKWHARMDMTAKKWLKFNVFNSKDNKELMDLMHISTILQIDPTMPFKSIMSPRDKMDLTTALPGSDRRKELDRLEELDAQRLEDYPKVKEMYDAMPKQAKDLYKEVRDAYNDMGDAFEQALIDNVEKAIKVRQDKAKRDYKLEMERIRDEGLEGEEKAKAEQAADRKLKQAETVIKFNFKARQTILRQQFETNKLAGPYFPLARNGKYFVTVRDKNSGKVLSFSRFESAVETRQFEDAMKKDPNHVVESGTVDENLDKAKVDPKFVADIEDLVAGLPNAAAVQDSIWQRYLETLPDLSLRKNRLHRKNRLGFNSDAIRAFANQMNHGAMQLSRLTFSFEMGDLLDQAKQEARKASNTKRSGQIITEANRHHEYIMSPGGGPVSQAVSQFAFIMYLGFSPVAGLINTLQTVQIGLPMLATYAGGNPINRYARAGKELTLALTDFVAGLGFAEKANIKPHEKEAMKIAYDLGVIDRTQSHDLSGVGEHGGSYSVWRTRVMNTIGVFFHHTERLNREVTFLAAYRIARKKGLDQEQAIKDASALTWDTHYDYQNTSRPSVMQSETARTLLVFRNFSFNMLARLFYNLHQSIAGESPERRKKYRQDLIGISAMTAFNAGIRGSIGYGLVMMIAGMFADDDEVLEEDLEKWLIKNIEPQAAGFVMNGFVGHATGTEMSGRIGYPDFWFKSPMKELESDKEIFSYWTEQALGAGIGAIFKSASGVILAADGEVYRGIEKAVPNLVGHPMKAYRYSTEGLTTKGGDPIMDVGFVDAMKQAVGATPASIAEQYRRNGYLYEKSNALIKEERRMINEFHKANEADDLEKADKIYDKLDAFYERYPLFVPTNLVKSANSRQNAKDRMDRGVNLPKKTKEQVTQDEVPYIYQ